MSQPDRFEAADLRCDSCQSNTDFYGIMKTHKKGRWVKWDDYAALAAENEVLRKKVDWLMKADRLVIWNGTEWQVRHVVEQPIKPRE